MKISVVLPIYLPSEEHRRMTDKNLLLAKERNGIDVEWVIVETGSNYYQEEADIYIHEKVKTNPNTSINRGFYCASGDLVVFLANDVEVCDNWISLMWDCFLKRLDCGIASLGNNEHKDIKTGEIVESLYFTVCMMKKKDAWFDSSYRYIFDDADLIFRLHTQGKKFYKNLGGIVNHKTHSTYGALGGDSGEYERSKQYFINKWGKYQDDPLYKRLVGIG